MSRRNLSDSILSHYLSILNKEKEEVLDSIRSLSEQIKTGAKDSSGDLSSFPIHLADLASDTESFESKITMLQREQEKLKQLNHAISNIYNKTYGICEICGEYISAGRLKVLPFATTCVDCTSKEEKKKQFIKHYGKIYEY